MGGGTTSCANVGMIIATPKRGTSKIKKKAWQKTDNSTTGPQGCQNFQSPDTMTTNEGGKASNPIRPRHFPAFFKCVRVCHIKAGR